MKAEISIVDVSPAMATEWLENSFDGQRKVRDSHVASLATEIIEGRWKLSCDAITIIKGKLGNGQHRCWAIVMSKKTVPCLLLRTDDESLFNVIDGGIKRTVADVLGPEYQYSQAIAAAAKIVLMMQKNLFTRFGQNTTKKLNGESVSVITRGEIIDYCRENESQLIEHAQFVCPMYEKKPILLKAFAIAFLQISCKKNKSKAIDFLRAVYLGGDNDVTFDLRERLIKNKLAKARLPQSYLYAITIKAYKAFLAGERPAVLKMVEGEQFPKI